MTDFAALLHTLTAAGVRYIVVGSAAATAHGAARLTVDLDVVYERTQGNLKRLVAALEKHNPYLRRAPPDLPFRFDAKTLRKGLARSGPLAPSASVSACAGSFRSSAQPAGPRIVEQEEPPTAG